MSEHHTTAVNKKSLKTLSAYVIGFVLSLALSIIAFVLVGKHMLPAFETYIAIAVLALVQFLVQAIFFLRLNSAGVDGKTDIFAFVFTIFVVLVVIFGSLWIMANLDYFMMH